MTAEVSWVLSSLPTAIFIDFLISADIHHMILHHVGVYVRLP
jgi:hypothetical protein